MKRTALVAAKVVVSVGLLAYVLLTSDLRALNRRLRTGDTVLLAGAILLYVAILLLSTWRWRVLLQAQGYRAPLRELSASYLVALFFNNFLPSNIGGDVIRVRDSSQLTGSTTASLAVVAIDRILGLGALYLLAAGAYLAGGTEVRALVGALPALVVLGVLFTTLAWVFFQPGIAGRVMALTRLTSIPWARARFATVQAAVHVYRHRMGTVWAAFLASLALQSLFVLYYYDVAHSLRIPLGLPACFLMVPLCALIQTVPVSFNGWGLRESVFILYFRQLGLPRDSALAFSLVAAGLIALLSMTGAVVWTSRGRVSANGAGTSGADASGAGEAGAGAA